MKDCYVGSLSCTFNLANTLCFQKILFFIKICKLMSLLWAGIRIMIKRENKGVNPMGKIFEVGAKR